MKSINSRQNPEIKALNALNKASGRKERQQFLAEGLRVLQTLIESNYRLVQLYTTEHMLESAQKITSAELITVVSYPVMAKISQAKTPSGLVGLFALPEELGAENLKSGLVLAEIADPGNMGTLIRTCAAMGFKSVVVVGGADPWGHKVVQASAGTIGLVDIFCWSWNQLLKNKKQKKLIALVARGGEQLGSLDPENSLLVVGNEARGLPNEWVESCDKKITLPMPGSVESLNAAVAGSIALYLVSK